MRAFLALALCAAAFPIHADEDGYDETPPIQRYLVSLHLGDSLKTVQKIYAPAQEWPSHVEPRGRVTRYRVERGWAKTMPKGVQTMWLGFKHGDLVDIQLIYDEQTSRAQPFDEMAGDVSLTYGEAKRSENRFWWTDGRTIMRVFAAEIPVLREGQTVTQVRTSLQVAEKGLFKRVD